MIDEETKRKLRELNLEPVIDILKVQEHDPGTLLEPFDERMKAVTDHLYQTKNNAKIQRLEKRARFRFPHADYTSIVYDERELDRNRIQSLMTCSFMTTSTNVIFQGYTGSGKTYLACALGKAACSHLYRTRYIRVPDLLNEYIDAVTLSREKGQKVLKKYASYQLLILDEWLMDDLTDQESYFIFELVERRYETASTVFCTQYRRGDWLDRLKISVRGDAITDRLVHNAIWVETGKTDMREYYAKRNHLE